VQTTGEKVDRDALLNGTGVCTVSPDAFGYGSGFAFFIQTPRFPSYPSVRSWFDFLESSTDSL
jgi:hypothetical protein